MQQLIRHLDVMGLGLLPEKYNLAQPYKILFLFEQAGLAKSVMRRFKTLVPEVWHDYVLFGLVDEVKLDPIRSWYRADGRPSQLLT